MQSKIEKFTMKRRVLKELGIRHSCHQTHGPRKIRFTTFQIGCQPIEKLQLRLEIKKLWTEFHVYNTLCREAIFQGCTFLNNHFEL